jgi:protein gp37
MEDSKIAWTNHTFNGVIGCSHVSPGCVHCYAETQNKYYKWNGGNWGPGSPRKVTSDDYWRQPFRWNKQAAQDGTRPRVFCSSLSDVMDPEWPSGVRERLWELILQTPNLNWLLLTKRPENFASMLPDRWAAYSNVWLGVTCENRKHGFPRVEILRNTPAVVRFLSCEPLLEDISDINLQGIDWVICGGESGSHAREFKTEWARSLRDACIGKNFFMKQLGSFVQIEIAKGEKKDPHGTDQAHFPPDLRVQTWPR